MNYYQVLQVDRSATTNEIKKHYYKLAKQYHPDKNKISVESDKFKLLSEAYSTLSNPKKRYIYDLETDYSIGEDFTLVFTEQDYELLHSYYEKIMNSTEIKFIKLFYKSLPENIRKRMKTKFNDIIYKNEEKTNSYTLISLGNIKYIDASQVTEDYVINLYRNFVDIYNNVSKQIIVKTGEIVYHLFITSYNYRIKIRIKNCFLLMNIIGRLDKFVVKNNDIIYEQTIDLYQYYFDDSFELRLGDRDITIQNDRMGTQVLNQMGLINPSSGLRGDLLIIFKVDLDKHNLLGENEREIVKSIFHKS